MEELRAERRLVTCLFVDVVGSTDATVRLGPERMQRLLSGAFGEMSALIAERGGTIEKYVGDAIFAIFGAPVAHADDPERALRAAEACVRWSGGHDAVDSGLQVRVGLETGEALVDLGGVERGQRMAVGECVNTAARLQQEAEPGQIVVGPVLHAATAYVARFESAGTQRLKGLGEIEAWRFVGFESGATPRVPFVGRERELQLLTDALIRADGGLPTLALIVGPPGQGKTRLATEVLARRDGADGLRLMQARCRPGAEAGTELPLRQLVNADVPDATAERVRDRLVELLGQDEGSLAAEAVSHAAGLGVADRLLATSRYEQRETIAQAWRAYLMALASERTLVAWIEDLHWADPILLRVIDYATSAATGRFAVLGTARPEFVGSAHVRTAPAGSAVWHSKWEAEPGSISSLVQIELPPLDDENAQELARLAGETRAAVARAGGNPLFIIELARAASASGAMPTSVQGAIEARLDELRPEERDMLQRASVAGETFDVRDAALLADLEPSEVAGMLARAVHRGFVDQVDGKYRFHHALVRDVAYGRVPVAQRMSLHAEYAARGVDPAETEVVAHHWWDAVNPSDAKWVWEDAARLARMRKQAFDAQLAAGQSLEQRNAYEEAQRVYERAMQLADDPADVAEAQASLGRAFARQGRGDEAWSHRMRAISMHRDAGLPVPAQLYADMLDSATFNWGYFTQFPDDREVFRLLDEGERAARESGEDVSLARLLAQRGSFTAGVEGLEEVERLVRATDDVQFADAAQRAATVLMWGGRISDAMRLYEAVFERLVPAGAVLNSPEALAWYGLCAYHAGELERASELAQGLEPLAMRSSMHTRSHFHAIQALVALGRGDWQRLRGANRHLVELVETNPDASFCLLGASAIGYGAAAEVLAGRPLVVGLDAFIARVFHESELIQAAAVMLPKVMTGDREAVDEGLRAYQARLRLYDRMRVWDVSQIIPAIALTMLERWDELGSTLERLDHVASGGGRLAEATAAAVREEMAATPNRGEPTHAQLHALGYHGISELLRFRPGQKERTEQLSEARA